MLEIGGMHQMNVFGGVRRLLLLVVVIAPLVFGAEQLRCSSCGVTIRGEYLRAGDNTYCSRPCFEKTLPRCTACNGVIKGKYWTLNGKPYCSQSCTEKQLPKCEICKAALSHSFSINGHVYCQKHANSDKCTRCGLPFAAGIQLPDKRLVCKVCNQDLVMKPEDARELLLAAQRDVAAITGYRSESLPELLLVGLDRLCKENDIKPREGLLQRGLYNRQVTTVTGRNIFGKVTSRRETVKERIFILYGLGPDAFVTTASHELTHDLLAEQFPAIPADAPLWFEEGICQYVAAMVSLRNGNYRMLKAIEGNPDPAYGDGYRYFLRLVGDANWGGLVALIRKTAINDLPERPPAADR